VRKLWDQYHGGHRTIHNMNEPGYRLTKGIIQPSKFNLSRIWLGMTLGLFLGAISFLVYAAGVIMHVR
jgi:hypothetical protein